MPTLAERPYSLLHHLCWGMLGNRDPSKVWIAVMTDYAVYSDDSGHPDDQPYVVVAGYIGSETEWEAFEPDWKEALARHKLRPVFHMADFMRESRSVRTRNLILGDLETIVSNHRLIPISGSVEIGAYKRVNDLFTLQEVLGAPYALAARALAISLNKWKADNLTAEDRVLFFAEEGTKHRGDMAEVFKKDNLREPVPVPKSTPQVQPADMLGWLLFQTLKDKYVSRRLRRLTVIRPEYNTVFHEKNLLATCANARVMARSTLSPKTEISFHSSPKRLRKRTIK